jgi:hypothetical protein
MLRGGGMLTLSRGCVVADRQACADTVSGEELLGLQGALQVRHAHTDPVPAPCMPCLIRARHAGGSVDRARAAPDDALQSGVCGTAVCIRLHQLTVRQTDAKESPLLGLCEAAAQSPCLLCHSTPIPLPPPSLRILGCALLRARL